MWADGHLGDYPLGEERGGSGDSWAETEEAHFLGADEARSKFITENDVTKWSCWCAIDGSCVESLFVCFKDQAVEKATH